MPKQNNIAEEDYLDNLLNSVLSGTDSGELKDDIFDEELRGMMGSDEDFFRSIEKEWMDTGERPEQSKKEMLPEEMAKEMFEKYKDPHTEEYRDVPPEIVGFEDKYGGDEHPSEEEQNQPEVKAETVEEKEGEEKQDDSQTDTVEDDMKGLLDILGVEQEGNEKDKQEISDLENQNAKKQKKEKKKRGFFGKKKKEENQEERNVDIALDLLEKNQEQAELDDVENTVAEPDSMLGEGEADQSGEGTESIDSLISDLGLGQGLEDIPDKEDLAYEESREDPENKKDKKKKKEKKKKEKKPKKKKDKKPKKPKKPKKEKKPREPKEPDEIIPISFPFLMFLLSIGALLVLATVFGGNYNNYQTKVSSATSYYVDQNYGKAYNELYGLSMKKGDEYFFHQVETVTYVYRNYEAYQNLAKLGYYQDALDSLLNGVRMFDKYKDSGREEYNCFDDMNTVLGWITTALNEVYGITESEAREINLLGRGKEYSYKVAEIAAGVQEGTETHDSNN